MHSGRGRRGTGGGKEASVGSSEGVREKRTRGGKQRSKEGWKKGRRRWKNSPAQRIDCDFIMKSNLLELARREVAEVVREGYTRSISEPRYVPAVLMRYQAPGDDDVGSRIVLETAEQVRSDLIESGKSAADEGQENVELPVVFEAEVRGTTSTSKSFDSSHDSRGPFYSHYYRFRITLPTTYPYDHPNIKLTSICHHLLVNDVSKELSPIVYETMKKQCIGADKYNDVATAESEDVCAYSLTGVLEGLHRFLSVPPTIPEVALRQLSDQEVQRQTDRFYSQWYQYAVHNRTREETISKWSSMSRHSGELLVNSFQKRWLAPELCTIYDVLSCPKSQASELRECVRGLVTELTDGVYSFPMFSSEMCNKIISESEDYAESKLPISRPNSMNNYGLVVNGIGMEGFIDAMQRDVLQPIASVLFPIEGCNFDGHHSFLVRYKAGEDLGLDIHTDDSDVTFNICLGKEFTGSGLTVCGMMGSSEHRQFSYNYIHKIGHCIVHRGRHRHGADDIKTGERINLIIWNHNSLYRQTDDYKRLQFVDESSMPDARCLSLTHDRDYETYANKDSKRRNKRKGWYPPAGITVPSA